MACSDLIMEIGRASPLCKLVYIDKQVGIAPRRSFEGFDQIEPLDREWPRDGNRLERFGLAGGSTEHSIDTLHRCA